MPPQRNATRSAQTWSKRLLGVSLALALTSLQGQTLVEPIQGEPDPGNSKLDAQLFYQLLLGELNVQGGEVGTGFALMLDAAQKKHDAQLYRRAVDVALQARSGESALKAAQAWAKDLPQATEPDRFVLQILLALNRAEETAPVLRSLINRSQGTARTDTINAIPQTFARVADKAVALRVVNEVLTPEFKRPEQAAAAWTTLGRMQLTANEGSKALVSARNGHRADPASIFPALLALELMEQGQIMAEDIVRGQLKASPPSSSNGTTVALNYARILLDLQRNADARTLLLALTKTQPELLEPWLLLASLQVQDNTLPAASESLQTYMRLARDSEDGRGARGLTQAYLLMSQIAEKQNDLEGANAWLDRIENADDIMAAQMRRASLLARQGKIEEARAHLRSQPVRRPTDVRLKLVAEAQLLREFKQWDEAYNVYSEAVKAFPDDQEMVYDQAMMAEKANRLDEMERLLRQIIAAKPDHHHAYNALGYSLADRGVRLSEAKQLIEKAVELQPDDAYIQDSLAWVEFRSGNALRALEILRSAFKARPDPEIAAHLGEVLWTQGQTEEAKRIWREGSLLSSDNETLQSTLKRFNVQP
ncbi:tetratricopeptide repeat protein [Hydrogenophaga crassostreae]|nr:tetratricopeptide repeat protein [Hydrogenophaga crassostreae]